MEYDYDKFLEDSSDDYPKYADNIKDNLNAPKNKESLVKDLDYKTRHLKEYEKLSFANNCDLIAEINPEALLADGYERALIGYDKEGIAIYDAYECLSILVWRDGMSREEAEEFFEFNTLGAYVGENTPHFIWLFDTRNSYIDLCNKYSNNE